MFAKRNFDENPSFASPPACLHLKHCYGGQKDPQKLEWAAAAQLLHSFFMIKITDIKKYYWS